MINFWCRQPFDAFISLEMFERAIAVSLVSFSCKSFPKYNWRYLYTALQRNISSKWQHFRSCKDLKKTFGNDLRYWKNLEPVKSQPLASSQIVMIIAAELPSAYCKFTVKHPNLIVSAVRSFCSSDCRNAAVRKFLPTFFTSSQAMKKPL